MALVTTFDDLPPLPGARHSYVQAGEVRLHLAETGPEDGPPILLVHGWPQHWWEWRKVVPELSSHRCLMPDLRGFGWSEAPAGRYYKAQLAEDMLRLLDALEIERVCFVGHDWGAITGFLLALRAPDRVSALLAMSVPHLWASRHDRLNPRRLAAFLYQLPLSTPGAELAADAQGADQAGDRRGFDPRDVLRRGAGGLRRAASLPAGRAGDDGHVPDVRAARAAPAAAPGGRSASRFRPG